MQIGRNIVNMKLLPVSIMLFSCTNIFAQSVPEVQKTLREYAARINSWSGNMVDEHQTDSLTLLNKQLLNYLQTVCNANPATIRANFDLKSYGRINVLTSEDSSFRIYCWEDGNNRSARSYNVLAQYKTGDRTKSVILNDVSKEEEGTVCSGSYYSYIYTIVTKDNETVYLTIDHSIFASNYGATTISAYQIKNGKLIQNYPLFKAKESLGAISIQYDLSIPENKNISSPPKINVSSDKQKISIPVITEHGAISKKSIVYIFDGNNYVFDKNAKQ